VSYTGPGTVIVHGYLGEPYLRLTATGVDENSLSPSTYLNRSLFADSVPTGAPAADVAPAWHRIGSTGRALWHDHRIHWMGRSQPPAVAADPRHAHEVGTWVVHATADGVPFELHGTLRWIGKPGTGLSIAPWQLVVANTLLLCALFGAFWYASRRRRRRAARTEPADGIR
jgi:hypothetical protein